MKSAAFLSCVLLLGIFLLPNFVAGQEAAESVTVEVTGIGKEPESALRNALYQAVEQAVGAYVDNETVIKNEEVIHEKLLSVAQGFVEKYEVIQPPRERRDGSGVWETRVSASVKRSEVGAALRAAGVMQVAADGTAAWAEQITRLKSREDAMELLEKLIPEIPRNLFVFSIVGGNGELRTVEDRNTGDRLTAVTLRLQSNLDWWHAEALPALEAALNVLRLSDAEPVIFEGPNKRVPEFTIPQYEENNERLQGMEGLNRPSNIHVLRGFAWEERDDPISKAMETGAIFRVRLQPYSLPNVTSYFLPIVHYEKITEIKSQLRTGFERSVVSSIDFLDASGELLKRSSLSLPTEFAQSSSSYSRSLNSGFFPYFNLDPRVQGGYYGRGRCTDVALEFLLPIEAEVLRDTKSLKLVPGTFGVSDGPLPDSATATDPVGSVGLAGGPSGVDPALTVPSAGPVPAMSVGTVGTVGTVGVGNDLGAMRFPIDELFEAWRSLDLERYMAQWTSDAIKVDLRTGRRYTIEALYRDRLKQFPQYRSVGADVSVELRESDEMSAVFDVWYEMQFVKRSGTSFREKAKESYVVVKVGDDWRIRLNRDYENE
ncbi:MAG: nuclear transport factor 2 family protein [Verrucomicrobiales bacterium]|nr:nuclear transport factor 2 family protein [Verrucomicrobiales bacterium]